MNPFEAYVGPAEAPPVVRPKRREDEKRAEPKRSATYEAPDLRRETGIGPWTLGAMGLLGAAALAARNPRIGSKLLDLWQRPFGPLERWTKPRPFEVPGLGIPGLPSELPNVRRQPGSILISDTERTGVNVARGTRALQEQPFYTGMITARPERLKDIEHQAVSDYLVHAATGMAPSRAKALALRGTPQWFREAQAYRDSMLRDEQWARRYLGIEDIPYRPGPYLHRQAVRNEAATLRGRGGLFGELSTSLRGAEDKRVFPTYRAGEAAGTVYDDPRVAWLSREVAGLRLIETAKYMQRLEGRVIFRDKAAARAVAGPGNRIYEIEAMPGAPKWYVPHYEEWKFLVDNLKSPEYGRLGFLRHWANTLARNPNLVNPLPHIVKNMAYKYQMAGAPGSVLTKLPRDFAEFQRGTSPMVRLFKQSMPFDETGETAADLFGRAIHGIRRESYPAPLRLVDLALDATVGRAHRASSKLIFSRADPAMRYSLWKQYVERGMTGNEAAQHVWVDLIRYGTRSTLVDAWKAIPGNFFVPWRLGTVTTLYKQITDHPFRTAAFIGAIDLVREMRYRQSGRWTHLPIDYVEAPIAQVIQSRDTGDAAKSLIAATLGWIIAGPGGALLGSAVMDVWKNPAEWRRLYSMFWGISQMIDGGKSAIGIAQHVANGRPDLAARDATNLMMTMATAEHAALNYRPRRLFAALPEVGPWLRKSVQVKMAEGIQQTIEMRGERAATRRERRKLGRGTIEERVKRLTEE